MYTPSPTLNFGDLFAGSGKSTTASTNPPEHSGAAAQLAENTGVAAGVLGMQVPALIALGVVAFLLIRFYD